MKSILKFVLAWSAVPGLVLLLSSTLIFVFNLLTAASPTANSESLNTSTTVINVSKLDTLTNKVVVEPKNIQHLKPNKASVVVLAGPVGPDTLEVAKAIIANSEANRPTYLVIDSPGGSVFDGAQVISAIEASKTPVYTICTLLCASMGAMIHQYGAKRFMFDRSILMFHDASGGVQGSVPQMSSRLEFIRLYVTKMSSHIAARSKQDLNGFLLKMQREVWVDAEDAVAQGYADGIVSLPLDSELNGLFHKTRTPPKRDDKIYWEFHNPEAMKVWNILSP